MFFASSSRRVVSEKLFSGRENPSRVRRTQTGSFAARRFLFFLFRWRGWIALPLLASLCFPFSLQANPSGGLAIPGQAVISSHGSTLTIHQLTDRAILHWQDFSIAAGETTRFVQPSATSAALNRVLGGNPSAIYGTLSSNGQIFLINPNGILVGPSGVVDTGGFLASTLDISDENFLSGGDLRFRGTSDASVVNLGKISASSSDVILIARTVENHGEIHAPNGTAALAAGSEVLVKADGEERIFVEAGSAEGTSKATQAGLVAAAAAEIKAAGGNEYALAIKHTGVTRATGVSKRGGRIFLSAGGKSTVRHSGTITAQKSDGNGGQVKVEAARIELAPASKIDVSADPAAPVGNGGEVLIGGGYQGQDPSLRNAETVTAEEGSLILADATAAGDGGRVILWSDDTTRFAGTISARGGAVSGDGGFVETSGSVLSLSGSARVNTSADHGAFGTWLLDPADMEIASGGGGDLTGSTVDPGAIVAALDGSNIVLLADNSITVSDVIDASGNVGVGHLTLDAPTLHLNAAILLRGGSVLSGTASTVNVGASGRVQNGIDAAAAGGLVNLLGATYGSTGSQLRIGKSLTMRGAAGGTVLDAQGNHGVLQITGDTSATGVVVTLDRLTVTGGDAVIGGGIYIDGISGRKTEVTITNSTVSGNSSDFYGGGIYNYGSDGSAELTIRNSTVSGNSSDFYGGGIYNNGSDGSAVLTIHGSIVSGNSAGFDGGGIYNDGSDGSAALTISNSTVSGNSAGFNGGGIFNYGSNGSAVLTIMSSTVSGNSAGFDGGGIYNTGSSGSTELTIVSSTISGNTADFDGGGIYNYGSAGSAVLTLGGTILAGNAASNGANYYVFNGTATSLGHNLSGHNFGGATDIHFTGNIATVLEWDTTNNRPVLQDNGGPTHTIALVAGSAAINAGAAGTLRLDQRGFAQAPSDTVRDIGAFEYGAADIGDPFLVTSVGDTSANAAIGELRTAIAYANANALLFPEITFDEAGAFSSARTIALALGHLHITGSQSITGSAAGVTLDAQGNSRVIQITGDTSATGVVVTLDRLTVTGGSPAGIAINGNNGKKTDVTLLNSTIFGNAGTYGGGIFNDGGATGSADLTIVNSTITGNSANYGAGMYHKGTGGSAHLTIVNSTITGNVAVITGGGIYRENGTTSIGGTLLAGNPSGDSRDFATGASGNTSLGHNLSSHNFGGATDIHFTGDIATVLEWDTTNNRPVLQDNGGPTHTIALVTGSAAYLAGGVNPGGLTDQRGLTRGETISIGAWDLDPTALSYVVTTAADVTGRAIGGPDLSLREAIWQANLGASATPPQITFDEAGVFSSARTIALALGQLHITGSQSITGSAAGVTLDAQGNSRVMQITGDTSATGVVVTLDRLTVTGGDANSGGGISIDGSIDRKTDVTIRNSAVSGNSADFGGGIYNYGYDGSAALTIVSSTVSGNSAAYYGGGIYNDGYLGSAELTIHDSTVSGNSADFGGGIYNYGYDGSAALTIVSSTVSGNSADIHGGGIYNDGSYGSAALTIRNSTVSGNSVAYYGGGIYNYGAQGSAELAIHNSTVSGNSAADNGGGIFNAGPPGSAVLTLGGTILAGNEAANGADYYVLGGTTTSLGYNLSGYDLGGATDIHFTGDIATVLEWDTVNNRPVLQDNGGPTHTIALVPGSLAIDAGGVFLGGDFDQRGEARSALADKGFARDIGAYELTWQDLMVNATAQTISYGDPWNTGAYTSAAPLIGALGLTGATYSGGALNAGIYAIHQGSLVAPAGYHIVFTGNTLTVTPRDIIAPIIGGNRTYIDNPANPGIGVIHLTSFGTLLETADWADPFSYHHDQSTEDDDLDSPPKGEVEFVHRDFPGTITTLSSGEVE